MKNLLLFLTCLFISISCASTTKINDQAEKDFQEFKQKTETFCKQTGSPTQCKSAAWDYYKINCKKAFELHRTGQDSEIFLQKDIKRGLAFCNKILLEKTL